MVYRLEDSVDSGSPDATALKLEQLCAGQKDASAPPSSTGEPGGKETGQHMSQYIVAAGPYAQAYVRLAASGFQLYWQSAPAGERAKMKRASKTKFTCPECGQNAWAKPDVLLLCGVCLAEHKQLQVMLAELREAA